MSAFPCWFTESLCLASLPRTLCNIQRILRMARLMQVPCSIVDVDTFFSVPAVPLLADLRYLQLLLSQDMDQHIRALVDSRRGRSKASKDLESPYYPLVLKLHQVLC